MYVFTPYYKSVIWGGSRICSLKGVESPASHIGESWEVSPIAGCESVVADGPEKGLTLSRLMELHGADLVGEGIYNKYGGQFPLLLKIIDAERDLSVQVHPDQDMARELHGCPGKTEMWYVVDHKPGVKIYNGFTQAISPDDYRKMVEHKAIMDVVEAHDVTNGDVYFVPPGRIHAIGGGNLLVEVQQASDITYRVYDFDRRDENGRPRELHTDLAARAINFKVYPGHKINYNAAAQVVELLSCDYFSVVRLRADGEEVKFEIPRDTCAIAICVDGECEICAEGEKRTLPKLHTLLVPASSHSMTVGGVGTILIAIPK